MLEIVHQNKDGKWYFWNEILADEYGPYNTEDECNIGLDEYCRNVLGYKESLTEKEGEEDGR